MVLFIKNRLPDIKLLQTSFFVVNVIFPGAPNKIRGDFALLYPPNGYRHDLSLVSKLISTFQIKLFYYLSSSTPFFECYANHCDDTDLSLSNYFEFDLRKSMILLIFTIKIFFEDQLCEVKFCAILGSGTLVHHSKLVKTHVCCRLHKIS